MGRARCKSEGRHLRDAALRSYNHAAI